MSRCEKLLEEPGPRRAGWSEKLYFFFAGSALYANIIFTTSCYPVFSELYSEYMYGFYAFMMGNLATFTYPFILYLVAGKSFNFQGSFTMGLCLLAMAVQVLLAAYFPGSRLACYAIFGCHNLSMAAGFTLQYKASRMLKYFDKACVQCFFSSYSFAVTAGTSLGFLLVALQASKTQYLLVEAAYVFAIILATFVLQRRITRDAHFESSWLQEARQDLQSGYSPSELWASLKTIKWHFWGMFMLFTTYASVNPALTTKMGPPSLSFEKWSNIQGTVANTTILLGSWSIFDPNRSRPLVNGLIFYSLVFCSWAFAQFLANDKKFTDSVWVCNVVGMFLLSFQVGFYLNYLMAQVVKLFPSDKRAMFLMNYAVSYGYLAGSLLTVFFAELRNRVHGIKE